MRGTGAAERTCAGMVEMGRAESLLCGDCRRLADGRTEGVEGLRMGEEKGLTFLTDGLISRRLR